VGKQEVLALIDQTWNAILEGKGLPPTALSEDLALLGETSPIDSLDLAQIVVELQSLTGLDPFQAGFIEFRTVGELAVLFSA